MSNFKKPKMIRIQNSLSFDMVKIEAGSFKMGSDEYDDEKPIHKVTIDYDFELGKYPVTIAEYMYFAKNNEEHLPTWKQEKLDNYEQMNLTDNAPIIGVSWHDAVAYCKWLNEQQKVYVYRLPTEEEWEHACRAGTTTKWSFGDDEKELGKYAWYRENSYDLGKEHEDYGTHVVGEKLPNQWGLYDMHGNVFEWCEDWYEKEEENKVLRGGSWGSDANYTRSASRDWNYPTVRVYYVGFRLLRTLP